MKTIFRNYLITLVFAGLAASISLSADTLERTRQRVATLKVVKLANKKPCAATASSKTVDVSKQWKSDETSDETIKDAVYRINETRQREGLRAAARMAFSKLGYLWSYFPALAILAWTHPRFSG